MRRSALHHLVLLSLMTTTSQARPQPGYTGGYSINSRSRRVLSTRGLPIVTCTADIPCENGACCDSNGPCGYPPTVCADGCTSHCAAKAECRQYGVKGLQECPLNVCCSQFGWVNSKSDRYCGIFFCFVLADQSTLDSVGVHPRLVKRSRGRGLRR